MLNIREVDMGNGHILVRDVSALPRLSGNILYMDLETSSGKPWVKSINPFKDCKIAGIAVTSDELNKAWYVPIGHHESYADYNLPKESVYKWLEDICLNHQEWCNHNIKYDYQVLRVETGIDFVKMHGKESLYCTLVTAKMLNTDRQFTGGYSLDVLALQDLGIDISGYEASLKRYIGPNNKLPGPNGKTLVDNQDYGRISPVVMTPYACTDVLILDRLRKHQLSQLPADMENVWKMERKLTPVLADMERTGMRIIPIDVKREEARALQEILTLEFMIHEYTGSWINASSSKQLEDLLLVRYGLPVIRYTEEDDEEHRNYKKNPSFDSNVLKVYQREYKGYNNIPDGLIDCLIELRHLKTYVGLFLKTYHEENVDGVLHGTFNQVLKTGRLSMRKPNLQQGDARSKALIVPREGYGIWRADYSQIEFRTIVHYIQDKRAIAAYNKDPDTDFHRYMADQCGIDRKPAKTLNFQNGYGGGEKKMVEALSAMSVVIKAVEKELSETDAWKTADSYHRDLMLKAAVKFTASRMYKKFHANLPTLKPTAKRASIAAFKNGYVRTLSGRRRHLIQSPAFTRLAFNAANQGSAADIMKYKIVELSDLLENTPIELLCTVHDEIVMEAPLELLEDPVTSWKLHRDLAHVLEDQSTLPFKLSIPLRCSIGWSATSWREASIDHEGTDGNGLGYDPVRHEIRVPVEETAKGERFSWLST